MRPVFIWGQPGIGKSALVEQFAHSVGLECVSLLGTQLAPEDLIGVPQITKDGKSRFCPPTSIARDKPYCLFLDELNASSPDVQKAFYSLIHDRRLGEYELPEGSVIIGAGNRTHDQAIVRQMSSALVNRMVHVHLRVDHRDWLAWAAQTNTHPLVLRYIQTKPSRLRVSPPKHEEPFSTPRSWHMLSDGLNSYGDQLTLESLRALAFGCVSADDAQRIVGLFKLSQQQYDLKRILNGERRWPEGPEDGDLRFFLAESLRSQLLKELPAERRKLGRDARQLAHDAKRAITQLAEISSEAAQRVIVDDEDAGEMLPDWFLVEVAADVPRLATKRQGGQR